MKQSDRLLTPLMTAREAGVKTLPEDVSEYAGTSEFSEVSVPVDLLKGHRTRVGAWAKIAVLEGGLRYGTPPAGRLPFCRSNAGSL